LLAALLGPVAAIALAASAHQPGSSATAALPGGGATVTVRTPCSGSVGITSTTVGPGTPVYTTVQAVQTVTQPIIGTGTATVTTASTATTSTATTTTSTATTTTSTATTTTTTTTTTSTATTTTGTATTTTAPTTTTYTYPTTTVFTESVPVTETATLPGTTTITETPACALSAPAPATIPVPAGNPFVGRAMWIWVLHDTDGGDIAAIIAQAKRFGITALYVKSSDGTQWWRQFSPALVTDLHEAGIRVCAWQYVYGVHPVIEANLGARAVRDGADCLVIDAESQYQSRYIAAQTYIARLRRLIGQRFPVGLAGFPYVGYHLTFPYSIFLGPGGAQYNLPQMYWADIGTSVQDVYAITYEYNELYRRPIFPLGQLWNSGAGMSIGAIEQFSLLAREYGATGVSWWDWQSAPLSYFGAITRLPPLPVSYVTNRTPASIFAGNRGDLVIWAQEHLYGAGYRIAIDGVFGPQTKRAVQAFQRRHQLAASGVVNGPTWDALLQVRPVSVRWSRRRRQTIAVLRRGARTLGHASAAATLDAPLPRWMHRIHPRNELHGDIGAGVPRTGPHRNRTHGG
jgi:hypothetical protein